MNFYKKNAIVQSNNYITARHTLSEVSHKLILLAVKTAIEQQASGLDLVSANSLVFVISAEEYKKFFDVQAQSAYKALKDAATAIVKSQWSYKEEDPATGASRTIVHNYVSKAIYDSNNKVVELEFTQDTLACILGVNNNFTWFELTDVSQCTGRYSIRLFELLYRFFNKKDGNGIARYTIEELRYSLGVGATKYPLYNSFKRYVLDLAIEQINANTPMFVEYAVTKKGRTIIGLVFTLSRNPKFKHKKIINVTPQVQPQAQPQVQPQAQPQVQPQAQPELQQAQSQVQQLASSDKQAKTLEEKHKELGEIYNQAKEDKNQPVIDKINELLEVVGKKQGEWDELHCANYMLKNIKKFINNGCKTELDMIKEDMEKNQKRNIVLLENNSEQEEIPTYAPPFKEWNKKDTTKINKIIRLRAYIEKLHEEQTKLLYPEINKILGGDLAVEWGILWGKVNAEIRKIDKDKKILSAVVAAMSSLNMWEHNTPEDLENEWVSMTDDVFDM